MCGWGADEWSAAAAVGQTVAAFPAVVGTLAVARGELAKWRRQHREERQVDVAATLVAEALAFLHVLDVIADDVERDPPFAKCSLVDDREAALREAWHKAYAYLPSEVNTLLSRLLDMGEVARALLAEAERHRGLEDEHTSPLRREIARMRVNVGNTIGKIASFQDPLPVKVARDVLQRLEEPPQPRSLSVMLHLLGTSNPTDVVLRRLFLAVSASLEIAQRIAAQRPHYAAAVGSKEMLVSLAEAKVLLEAGARSEDPIA